MSRLLNNTIYYSIGNFTSKGVAFLLLPLYTSYLAPEEYGVVTSMQVFSNILIVFLTFGLERAIYRLYHDYKNENDRKIFLGTISISIAVISVLICCCIYFLDSTISKLFKSIDFYPYFSYAILTALFMTYEFVPKISLQVKEQGRKYLFISLVSLTLRVLPVIWYVVYREMGAIGMLKGAMIGNAAALLIFIPITRKHVNFVFDFEIFKKTLKYSLPFIPMIISAWIVNMSDRIFIEQYFSTYDVGIYSLAYKIGQVVQLLSVSVLMAYNPYFYKMANSGNQLLAKEKLYKINNLSIFIMLILGFLVALFSRDIIQLFFPEKYQVAYKIIPIIVLGYFFIQLISLQSRAFYQAKKTLIIMYLNIVAAVVNIVLNFILISKYSYVGAAWSTVFTQFIFFALVYKFSKSYYFVPYNWKLIIPAFLAFLFLGSVNTIYFPVSLHFLLFKIGLTTLVFSVIAFSFRKKLNLLKIK